MPWGTLASPSVAESEGQWWTAGISLGSMDLEAGVEGQNGHMRPLLTSCPAPTRPHLEVVLHLTNLWAQLSPSLLSSSSHYLPQASSFPVHLLPKNPSPLSFLMYSFNANITLVCSPVPSYAQIPVLDILMHSDAPGKKS